MNRIIPFLWFDQQAEEAARLYTELFEDSAIGRVTRYNAASAGPSGVPEGSVMTAEFTLAGAPFVALNGGPVFRFTPAVSFYVSCETPEEVDRLHAALSEGGTTLMPLDSYPFSERYAWINDRFGVSWQLNLAPGGERICPALLFVGDQAGKAEEAMALYTSLFGDSAIGDIARYEPEDYDPATGTIKHAAFTLRGHGFKAADSSLDHPFTFTEATSFMVPCHDQAEVDRLWDALTRDGQESQCGWLKDRYGVSWQIVPTALQAMLRDPDPEKAERVTEAMLGMRKLDIAELEAARE